MNRPTLLRILTIALAFVMIASACGQAAEPAEPAEPAGAEPAEPAEPAASGGLQIPDVVDGQFNVAWVLIGPHDDGGWSQAHYEGLEYIQQNVPNTHVAYVGKGNRKESLTATRSDVTKKTVYSPW